MQNENLCSQIIWVLCTKETSLQFSGFINYITYSFIALDTLCVFCISYTTYIFLQYVLHNFLRTEKFMYLKKSVFCSIDTVLFCDSSKFSVILLLTAPHFKYCAFLAAVCFYVKSLKLPRASSLQRRTEIQRL